MAISRAAKSAVAAIALCCVAAVLGSAQDKARDKDQDQDELRAARGLGITAEELDKVEAILEKDEAALAKARAEIQIVQARIARALLEKDPDTKAIRGMVQESLDWELKARMIQIERQIAIRGVLGEDRWAGSVRLMQGKFARPAEFKLALKGGDADALGRLRKALERLR